MLSFLSFLWLHLMTYTVPGTQTFHWCYRTKYRTVKICFLGGKSSYKEHFVEWNGSMEVKGALLNHPCELKHLNLRLFCNVLFCVSLPFSIYLFQQTHYTKAIYEWGWCNKWFIIKKQIITASTSNNNSCFL